MTKNMKQLSALVLSSTPPFPRDYGNRNRVFQTNELLKLAGFSLSFLLYPFDEDWVDGVPDYYKNLVDSFEYFAVVPNSKILHQQAVGFHHEIDEWWDDNISEAIKWLVKRKKFDLILVNYTFFSKAFSLMPKGTLRILDTHDIFTGRRETFESFGVASEFFYTNEHEEKKAFDRADMIIAIKNSEATIIKNMTTKSVVAVPYWDAAPAGIPKKRDVGELQFSHDRPLKIGFIGAQNSVNVVNINNFIKRLDRYIKLYNLPIRLVVAGNVCRKIIEEYSFLEKLGRVEHLETFYSALDLVVAPLDFSTGIKIKVGEALAWQLPVIATANAFDGFNAYHSTQREESVASLCQSLAVISTNELSYSELIMAARRAARAAARGQEKGFYELSTWIRKNISRIVVCVDRAFWYRETFIDEAICQAVEFLSGIASTIVVCFENQTIKRDRVYADVRYIQMENVDDIGAFMENLVSSTNVIGFFSFLGRQKRGEVLYTLSPFHYEFWESSLGSESGSVRFFGQTGDSFNVASLRYAPVEINRDISKKVMMLLLPKVCSDWVRLIVEYIKANGVYYNIILDIVEVPPYCEFDTSFFKKSMGSSAGRVISLEPGSTAEHFVFQAAKYRGLPFMSLNESYICPQLFLEDSDLPSTFASIDSFMSNCGAASLLSGPDTGWDNLWNSIERMKT